MSNFNELKETQVLRGLFATEEVLIADLVNLAGRAADEIAQIVGPIKGTFQGGQGQVTVAGLGMLFIEEYETQVGNKRLLKYIPRENPKERGKHTGYITQQFGPGEKYLIGPNKVIQGASSDVYVRFAQKIDKVVEKMSEKKSRQVAEIQQALTQLRNYILNGEKAHDD